MNKILVSVIIPTFNEEHNIEKCLKSIRQQEFPKSKYEILVVDDSSTDKTVNIANKYKVKVILHNGRHGEKGKLIGFKKAKGKYAIYLDADNEMVGTRWFQKMIEPLEKDKSIVGSFTFESAKETDSPLERFYSFDPLQRDTIYKIFSPSIKSTIVKKYKNYSVCEYSLNKIPPAGRCLYRRKKLLKQVEIYDMFMELDFLSLLVTKGFTKFAYVHKAGLYHHHASSIKELLRKRRYNIKKVYLATYKKRLYKWFELTNPKDLVKILLLIIYANTFIFSTAYGIYLSIRNRDWAGMYEPIVTFFVTNQIVVSMLLDKRFKKLIK